MPMPWTFRHADKEWARFLTDIRETMGTPSDNVAYTTADGVFRAFRARLTPQEAARFAQVLPALPRALFFEDWAPGAPRPWADTATYLAEAKALRAHHNLTNDLGLEAVSYAVHRAVAPAVLRKTLRSIGPEAEAFWALPGHPDDALQQHGF